MLLAIYLMQGKVEAMMYRDKFDNNNNINNLTQSNIGDTYTVNNDDWAVIAGTGAKDNKKYICLNHRSESAYKIEGRRTITLKGIIEVGGPYAKVIGCDGTAIKLNNTKKQESFYLGNIARSMVNYANYINTNGVYSESITYDSHYEWFSCKGWVKFCKAAESHLTVVDKLKGNIQRGNLLYNPESSTLSAKDKINISKKVNDNKLTIINTGDVTIEYTIKYKNGNTIEEGSLDVGNQITTGELTNDLVEINYSHKYRGARYLIFGSNYGQTRAIALYMTVNIGKHEEVQIDGVNVDKSVIAVGDGSLNADNAADWQTTPYRFNPINVYRALNTREEWSDDAKYDEPVKIKAGNNVVYRLKVSSSADNVRIGDAIQLFKYDGYNSQSVGWKVQGIFHEYNDNNYLTSPYVPIYIAEPIANSAYSLNESGEIKENANDNPSNGPLHCGCNPCRDTNFAGNPTFYKIYDLNGNYRIICAHHHDITSKSIFFNKYNGGPVAFLNAYKSRRLQWIHILY